ncbi:MAG: flagellar hook-length control protein FliK [Treponema sp.]
MQTLDIQQDIQPVHYAKAGQSDNRTPVHSDEDAQVFHKMMQDMLAEAAADPEEAELLGAEGKHMASDEIKEKNTDKLSLPHKSRKKDDSAQNNSQKAVHAQETSGDEINTIAYAAGAVEAAFVESGDSSVRYGNAQDGQALQGSLDCASSGHERIYGYEEAEGLGTEDSLLAKKDKKRRTSFIDVLTDGKKVVSLDKAKKARIPSETEEKPHSIKPKEVKQVKPVFTVVDERTMPQIASVAAGSAVHEAGAAVMVEDTTSADMVLDMHGANENYMAKAEAREGAQETTGSSFSSILAERIQDMAGDFVQTGNIILKDNNAGIIRLHLQPAYLGTVKINLELGGDKRILGKIVVGSKESYDAFKESVETLAEAFEAGGFSDAHFDVSWSGETGSGMAQGNSDFDRSFAENTYLEVMQEKHYADTGIIYEFEGNQTVNVLA